MGVAVFQKLWDASNNLKQTDKKINEIFSERINAALLK